MSKPSVRIGGASGYWGESDMALPQFFCEGDLDYIVFDYLAEITMSIMARARSTDESLGYATDFVHAVMAPHLAQIAEQGVKIVSNAGGVNPLACAQALRDIIDSQGLELKVAVVLGDDLIHQKDELAALGVTEMFSGEPFPPVEKIASINAYLGAFPIAEALAQGADIVITGRCVDSAVTLGACIHEFGWTASDLDCLAGASLAGHLIECGPQATGGNFTDWHGVADSLVDVGYPIATVFSDGSCDISKPRDTGGLVSVGTVCEQLLYEIGDPGAYYLPDVICDFTHVDVTQLDAERVRVEGAIGAGVPEQLKVSMTWADGWRLGGIWFYVGASASRRARSFGESAVARARAKLTTMKAPDFDEVLIELVGDGSHFGAYALESETREVAVKVAAKHQDKRALMLLLKELSGVGLAAPAGLAGFAGTRPKPSPVIRLFSFLRDRNTVAIELDDGIQRQALTESGSSLSTQSRSVAPEVPAVDSDVATVQVPLERLAWGRSGDKGNKANIGVIARKASYLPWIAATLTEACVSERLAHFMGSGAVARYYLPGISALNFLIDDVLGGGGVASLRNDPQGKTYAQILLQTPVAIPAGLLED